MSKENEQKRRSYWDDILMGGMSVRQYAAIQMAKGILPSITLGRDEDETVNLVTSAAIKHADALLKALEESK